MLSNSLAAYGAAPSFKESGGKKKATAAPLSLLVGCLLIPFAIFVIMFCLRSFDLHYSAAALTNIICYALLGFPLAFGFATFSTLSAGGDHKPMALLACMALIAWVLGFILGDSNFHTNMQPFYDIRRLNVYPSVDPSKYGGMQLMDAGQIQFTAGSKVLVQKSMGFKNGDIYCVAPIVSGNATQASYDFWAVGINCCSGHTADFHCGEFSSTAKKGLRLMDHDKRDMFNLVVKKAEAEYNMKVSHPIFLHWLSDPAAEVNAYQDDGYTKFVMSAFVFFSAQLVVIVCSLALFAKTY